jgi:hypothetical protein
VVMALGVNWIGDSLDGSWRVYGKQRPRYGFNVDRIGDSIDAITSLVTRPIAFHNGGRTLLR